MDGIQPVMSMNPSGYGAFGGDDGLWIFALLILLGMGGGGLFGNGGRAATVEDLNNSANFTRLESQVMNNGNRIESKTDYITNGLSSLGYEMAQQFGATRTALSECCCENRLAVANTNAHIDQSTASINATTTAGIQKVLDKLCEDKVSALQGRISQLELQSALAGVVRYPSALTYSAGVSPFCATSCGCSGYGYAI